MKTHELMALLDELLECQDYLTQLTEQGKPTRLAKAQLDKVYNLILEYIEEKSNEQ